MVNSEVNREERLYLTLRFALKPGTLWKELRSFSTDFVVSKSSSQLSDHLRCPDELNRHFLDVSNKDFLLLLINEYQNERLVDHRKELLFVAVSDM